MKLPRRRFLHLTAGAAALPAISRIATAQAYPARPVRIIVSSAAGSAMGSARSIARPDCENPVIIKKYPDRRLYNTATHTFMTLDDLADLVRQGIELTIHETKSGKDITRSVLLHIILERESKVDQNLLPTAFLRQLIRFYGHSMQMIVPVFLDVSLRSGRVNVDAARGRDGGQEMAAGAVLRSRSPLSGANQTTLESNPLSPVPSVPPRPRRVLRC